MDDEAIAPPQPFQLRAGEARLLSAEQLLSMHFFVPQFQRPYDWEDEQVEDFIADVRDSQRSGIPLFLGMVVLHREGDRYGIIDGQQRLTTLMLALASAGQEMLQRSASHLTESWIRPRQADSGYMRSLLQHKPESPNTLSQRRTGEALHRLRGAALQVEELLKCEVIAYVSPTLAGATRLFERINLRGKDVCKFDLVKNKLIDWAARETEVARLATERLITERYDKLYQLLDPGPSEDAYDSDRLLRVHWILFRDAQFKSSDQVLEKLEAWLDDEIVKGRNFGELVEAYLDSLVEVTELWAWVERPQAVHRPGYDRELYQAVLDFAKLRREGELHPLIIAAIKRFGSKATPLVRFCEINSIRAALSKKNSNHGRAFKWRLARQLYNRTLVDARGQPIGSPADVVHQLFWRNTPWWSKQEAAEFDQPMSKEEIAGAGTIPVDALDSASFHKEYPGLIHYIFWNYGKDLLEGNELSEAMRVDISPFQEAVWFHPNGFRSWDIEHIYPRNPDDVDTPHGRQHKQLMEPWLQHLGNLTVLPIPDNRGLQNRPFLEKLKWLREQQKVPFNELLAERSYTGNLVTSTHWGPNNCRKRVRHLQEFATRRWGTAAIEELGVGPWDDRIEGWDEDTEESDY